MKRDWYILNLFFSKQLACTLEITLQVDPIKNGVLFKDANNNYVMRKKICVLKI